MKRYKCTLNTLEGDDRDFPEDAEPSIGSPLTPHGQQVLSEALSLLRRVREHEQNHYALVDSAVAYDELPPCHHGPCVACDVRAFLENLAKGGV